jgi:AraC-like DNA-binding protein
MLNANLILFLLVALILLRNHFGKNKGIIYAIIALLAVCFKVVVESFPLAYFNEHPLTLRIVLIHPIINFIIAPLVLLYIESVVKKRLTLSRYFLLFIPFLICLINFLPFYYLPIEDKIQIYTQANDASAQEYFIWFSYPVLRSINNIYNPLIGMITMGYLFQILIRNKEKLSKKTYLNLLQLGFILAFNFIVIRVLMFYQYISDGQEISPEILGVICILVPLSFIIFPNFIYDNSNNSDLNLYFRIMNRISGSSSNEDSVKSELLTDSSRIMKYLNEDKPYLSPGFSIHDIAKELDIPQKNVTECFNKVIKISFPKMRNQLRVDYAIEMFKNNSQLKISIEGISSESGFNNRATFYKAFREVTNTTPIEWIRQNCNYTVEEELDQSQ